MQAVRLLLNSGRNFQAQLPVLIRRQYDSSSQSTCEDKMPDSNGQIRQCEEKS